MDSVIKIVGIFTLFPALMLLGALWRGFVLATLWAWFMVAGLHLPAISVPLAIGLSLLVGMLTNHRTGNEIEKDRNGFEAIGYSCVMSFLYPAFTLLIGYVAKGYL